MSQLVEALMNTSLGNLLTTDDAKSLAQTAKARTLRRGECLFTAGDPGDALAVVISGSLEVILGQPGTGATVVATVGAGQVVGELEVMTKSRRVATLVATTDSEVLEVEGNALEGMLERHEPAATKIMVYIAKTLARRLAAVNQRIIDKAPKAPPPTAPAPDSGGDKIVELDEADVVAIDDDDLEVLDKLWG